MTSAQEHYDKSICLNNTKEPNDFKTKTRLQLEQIYYLI